MPEFGLAIPLRGPANREPNTYDGNIGIAGSVNANIIGSYNSLTLRMDDGVRNCSLIMLGRSRILNVSSNKLEKMDLIIHPY